MSTITRKACYVLKNGLLELLELALK